MDLSHHTPKTKTERKLIAALHATEPGTEAYQRAKDRLSAEWRRQCRVIARRFRRTHPTQAIKLGLI